MSLFDILRLSIRNLREARLRATLTTMGVVVGVTVIVTMISFGLGLQRNTVNRFKSLDLFNEVAVFGRSLSKLLSTGPAASSSNAKADESSTNINRAEKRPDQESTRTLDDAALEEIARIPGVASVEPNVSFSTYVRSNGRSRIENIAGILVPNLASRFKEFNAGSMISPSNADQIIVTEDFLKDFGYASPADAVGKSVELLALPRESEYQGGTSLFGIPIEDEQEGDHSSEALVARRMQIAGVLKESGGPRFRGLSVAANIYTSLAVAKGWNEEHRNDLSQVAMQLAREAGALNEGQSPGYNSAIARVNDPVVLTEVRKRLTELGFGSFSIVDQLDQLKTFFLIMNSVLGLLGGISLLVASFGIANTMIMSILERTREIGIMKAIGAEDLEIKLIFFVEAAVIGLTGGVVGSLAAWGIEGIANRLAYRFILKPQGSNYVDFFALPAYLWLGAILFAIVISILAALYPAARAARIDPVKALRHD
jgi:ABC-type antimicrobial peptide transport system permease subunit